ncbi:transmembrane protein 184C-like isoform X2 [Varroa destructor]|uniref:Transmembrane protein 184C n=1 Tax=Varroa destructor TaxID=109461 RepID=A0A7M7KZA9_VARDE|nr:transmembrane protein 184C-like isoform X2 [Varroa destructor]
MENTATRTAPSQAHGSVRRQISFKVHSCLRNWRIWFKAVSGICYLVVLTVFLPWWITKMIHEGASQRTQAFLAAGAFLMMTSPVTLYEIAGHIANYSKPYLQKHIIRVLWMVPIYSINSWISLGWPQGGFYLDVVRECYEAYVIYNFMMFLLNYLFYDQDYDPVALGEQPSVKHIFPLCFLTPCRGGMTFIDNCRHGILQYTVVRVVTTFIAVVTEAAGSYCEGEFNLSCWFPWVLLANNISQFVAMYSLVMFYKAYRSYLAPMSPIGKFLCIKAVVFFSFFQSVLINIYIWWENKEKKKEDQADVAATTRSIQDFLICIEMFLAAIAHHYTFSYKPYLSDRFGNISFIQSLLAMVDVSDVTSDMQQHIRVIGNSVTSLGNRRLQAPHEEAHLLRSVVASTEEEQLRTNEEIRRVTGCRRFHRLAVHTAAKRVYHLSHLRQ